MLFCSEQYLVFFTLIFVVYWSLPHVGVRLGVLLAAAVVLTWNAASWMSLLATLDPVIILNNLLASHYQDTLAAIVLLGALAAFVVGADRGRVWLLLLASYFFYASWNHWLAGLIFLSTTIDYWIGRGLDAWTSPRGRRVLLGVSLIANLGLLCYFKYVNFFLESLEQALRAAGGTTSLPLLQVILPIGISFYTFEAINYTIDVYRRKAPAERNLANFMLFITFFPHLVAGPIVRAKDFLPQIERVKQWNWSRLQLGAQYFLLGLFKKLAIADRMAVYADPVFADPSAFSSHVVWLAALAYALQIYCDFSGYTDMALGSAHMLGYKLAMNFNMPYLSKNISEFWRRWHISLSTWLRDYLFIPLGGSRNGSWQTARNLMITMTLGGLWHGANWTFVIWGMLHGTLLIGHRAFRSFSQGMPRLDSLLQSHPGIWLRIGLTFSTVSLCWIFFRAQTLTDALTFLHRMFIPFKGRGAEMHNISLFVTLAVMLLCHILVQRGWWRRLAIRLPAPVMGFGYAAVLTLALMLAPDAGKAFIYFQF
ncbi:MAG: MBOAT family O-acyltransferase [Gemmataceae bacterium]